ncbi:GNAT family N-acetyltransferase [Streptomyces chartreusis]|uniref:GNAT family N-acetyltransferase n=1 Tax=Streptomyces chartreusis TaxID=1969 RepID=UPI0036A0B321
MPARVTFVPALALTGTTDSTNRVPESWQKHTGAASAPFWKTHLYRLGTLTPPQPRPEGQSRLTVRKDRDQIVRWCREFCVDVGGQRSIDLIDAGSWEDSRFGDRYFPFWETREGAPVSMAAATSVVGGMIRVHLVLYPGPPRGRGYAGTVTVEASRAAPAAGATDVVLFTDPDSPTSNALYQRIGNVRVGDFAGYKSPMAHQRLSERHPRKTSGQAIQRSLEWLLLARRHLEGLDVALTVALADKHRIVRQAVNCSSRSTVLPVQLRAAGLRAATENTRPLEERLLDVVSASVDACRADFPRPLSAPSSTWLADHGLEDVVWGATRRAVAEFAKAMPDLGATEEDDLPGQAGRTPLISVQHSKHLFAEGMQAAAGGTHQTRHPHMEHHPSFIDRHVRDGPPVRSPCPHQDPLTFVGPRPRRPAGTGPGRRSAQAH